MVYGIANNRCLKPNRIPLVIATPRTLLIFNIYKKIKGLPIHDSFVEIIDIVGADGRPVYQAFQNPIHSNVSSIPVPLNIRQSNPAMIDTVNADYYGQNI